MEKSDGIQYDETAKIKVYLRSNMENEQSSNFIYIFSEFRMLNSLTNWGDRATIACLLLPNKVFSTGIR